MVRLTLALIDANAWHDDVPKIMQERLGAMQQRGAWEGNDSASTPGALSRDREIRCRVRIVAGGGHDYHVTLGTTADQLEWARSEPAGATCSILRGAPVR